MEFQEYPKALYKAGQQLDVEDAEQEAAARAHGHDDWHADHERTNSETDDEHPLDRDALKARASDLGIDYPANIKTDKLAALVAAAQGE